MRHWCVRATLALGLFVSASAMEIPRGTHVLLRLVNSVDTRTAQEGDYVYMRTATPVVVDGRVAIPTGSYVQALVAHARRSGRVHGRAELGIRLETLSFANGKTLRFSPRLSSVDSSGTDQKVDREENIIKQGPGYAHDAAQIAILTGAGAWTGGIADRSVRGAGIGSGIGGAVGLATVLASRGREVRLRQGSTLDVVFDRAVLVE